MSEMKDDNNYFRPLPWSHVKTCKIEMTQNDVWAFGPTILEKGQTYELPIDVAGYFLASGTAILILKQE